MSLVPLQPRLCYVPKHRWLSRVATVPFSAAVALSKKSSQMPPRPKSPPETEIEESFVRGTGPGGQKINKTSSAVQLRHRPTGIMLKCQATRSRAQNRNIARQLLADRIDDLYQGEQSRSAVVGKIKRKKQASSAKKKRRKYRKLEEGRAVEGLDDEHEGKDVGQDMEQDDEDWVPQKKTAQDGCVDGKQADIAGGGQNLEARIIEVRR